MEREAGGFRGAGRSRPEASDVSGDDAFSGRATRSRGDNQRSRKGVRGFETAAEVEGSARRVREVSVAAPEDDAPAFISKSGAAAEDGLAVSRPVSAMTASGASMARPAATIHTLPLPCFTA